MKMGGGGFCSQARGDPERKGREGGKGGGFEEVRREGERGEGGSKGVGNENRGGEVGQRGEIRESGRKREWRWRGGNDRPLVGSPKRHRGGLGV